MTDDLRRFKARVKGLSEEEQRAAFGSEEFRKLIADAMNHEAEARAVAKCTGGHCKFHCRNHCKRHVPPDLSEPMPLP